MAFRDDVPDYRSYNEDKYFMDSAPANMWSELKGFVMRAAKGDNDKLIEILNHLAEIIPCEPTTNWGGDFLRSDVSDFIGLINKKVKSGRFDVLMDCLMILMTVGHISVKEMNEFLEEHKIGYRCESVSSRYGYEIHWSCREPMTVIDIMSKTQKQVLSASRQAYQEIERAKVSLASAADERARKDAVRSCISAMEAVIKEYGKDNEIEKATSNLRNAKDADGKCIWGIDPIVKEGISIFNAMHRFYPDLRHGSTESSTMSLAEAEYWIGRISIFLQYMKNMADEK